MILTNLCVDESAVDCRGHCLIATDATRSRVSVAAEASRGTVSFRIIVLQITVL